MAICTRICRRIVAPSERFKPRVGDKAAERQVGRVGGRERGDQLDVRRAARRGESPAGERELVVSGGEALVPERRRGFRPEGGRSAVHCEQRDGRGAHACVRGDRAQVPRRVHVRGDDRWRRLDPLRGRQAFQSAHSRQRCLFFQLHLQFFHSFSVFF